jgi:predicted DNA-binding ribbon-helix-helix protein
MAKQKRNGCGQFAAKSDTSREVRSIRLTEATWQQLGEVAEAQSLTRADLIEQLTESGALGQMAPTSGLSLQQVDAAIAQILNDPIVTRHGKDRGSVRRALEALRNSLTSSV